MTQGPPLTNFSRHVLATAIEQNGVECCLSWAAWPEMEHGRDGCMAWTITDIPFAFFNNVFSARLPQESVESAIAGVIGRLRRRNVPGFWWTGPATQPADLGRRLEAAGFEMAFDAPAMAVDLDAVRDARPIAAGSIVEEVVDRAGLEAWCRVMTPIYQFPDFAADAWLRMLASLGLGADRPLRHFLARVGGKPVATASLCLGAGVAGLSSVATLPDYRHRGLGTALTVAVLQEARRVGYRVGTLFSSVMGRGMYKRIGFQEYGRGSCYVWSPDRNHTRAP